MLHRFLVLLLTALTVTTVAARAGQPAGSQATVGELRETRLPNGLRILTREMRHAPVVHFSVYYPVGSRNERTGVTGVSHLLEHLLFKGTKKLREGEIARTLFANGANFNAHTFSDFTRYVQTLASDRLETAIRVEADRMVNSRIDQADLDSEMSVVRSELEGSENNPANLLWTAVQATAFQSHPYRWPVIGWRSDVENVTRDAIYRYYRAHYGPNNATVVMVGDFKTDQAVDLVRRYFGGIKPIPTPSSVYTAEPPQRGERRVVVRRPGAVEQVLLAWKTPEGKSPDFYALDVISSLLGHGNASRIHQALVEKKLASEAGVSNPTQRDPYLFLVNAKAQAGVSARRLEAVILQEIDRLKETPVSQAELDRAKTQIESDTAYRRESSAEQAHDIGYWLMVSGDPHYGDTYLPRIRAVTAAEIQRIARKYFVAGAQTVGHFLPAGGEGVELPEPKSAARVERKQGARPIPLPKPVKTSRTTTPATRFTLANGISVVVQENPASPTFALQGSVPAGRVFSPAGSSVHGLAAALLTRSTQRRSARELAEVLESAGASLSYTAGNVVTTVTGRGLTRGFDRVMDLLAETVREPAFTQEDLDFVKARQLAALEGESEDPQSVAERAFRRAIYPEGNPLRLATLEQAKAELAAVTREDIVRFYRRHYGPDRMLLALAGDVQADRVRQALESRLGNWPRNPQAPAIPEIQVELPVRAVREVVQMPDKSEASVIWGHAPGVRRSDPQFYAAMVLDTILGGDFLSSRLAKRIRDEEGLAYSVWAYFDWDLFPGPFRIDAGVNPANVEKAVTSLQEEVQRVRASGVTQREVEEAVAYLTGSYPLRLETNAGLAANLWEIEFYNLGSDYTERRSEYYQKVTAAQVSELARTHLHPDRAALVIAGTVPAK